MRHVVVYAVALGAVGLAGCGGGSATESPSPVAAAVESTTPRVRQPADLVGYTHAAAGIERVVAHASELEKHRFAENAQLLGIGPDTVFVGAIAPHDDYLYAQQAYVHVFSHVQAREVLLIGVAHKAREFPAVEDKLVFDSHTAWHGPYGAVPISPLRQELLDALGVDAVVHDELHSIEHSVEALVPFLQHQRRDVEIVPVLVPYMSWERLAELADRTAAALGRSLERRGLILGQDVAVLISSDSVHYGDQGWGGKRFADFGVDQAGYDRAVERDLNLIRDHLTGEIDRERLAGLYRALLADDYHEYRVSWCGRFSIPFGVALLGALPVPAGRLPPRGELLRYGTSLDPGRTDPGVDGLDVTAPADLRHWVGFAAIGYR